VRGAGEGEPDRTGREGGDIVTVFGALSRNIHKDKYKERKVERTELGMRKKWGCGVGGFYGSEIVPSLEADTNNSET